MKISCCKIMMVKIILKENSTTWNSWEIFIDLINKGYTHPNLRAESKHHIFFTLSHDASLFHRAKLTVVAEPYRDQRISSAELSASLILLMNCNNCAMNRLDESIGYRERMPWGWAAEPVRVKSFNEVKSVFKAY